MHDVRTYVRTYVCVFLFCCCLHTFHVQDILQRNLQRQKETITQTQVVAGREFKARRGGRKGRCRVNGGKYIRMWPVHNCQPSCAIHVPTSQPHCNAVVLLFTLSMCRGPAYRSTPDVVEFKVLMYMCTPTELASTSIAVTCC